MVKILVIDDDELLKPIIVFKLQEGGYEVETAQNGRDGLASARANKPDLILMDLLMPQIDGWELLKILRNDSQLAKVPVVVLTNIGEADSVKERDRLGVAEYWVKAHFTPSELLARIKKILPPG